MMLLIDLLSNLIIRLIMQYVLLAYAIPALPTWILSPVNLSSLRSTGQLVPSAFTRVISSFVPRTLNLLSSGLMPANNGNLVL